MILIAKLLGIYNGGIDKTDYVRSFDANVDLTENYNICLDIFENSGLKITKIKFKKDFVSCLNLNINSNVILLAKIMCLFSKKEELKKGNAFIAVGSLHLVYSYGLVSLLRKEGFTLTPQKIK